MVSCFCLSYELTIAMDTKLRSLKMCRKVPILHLISDPYLGHMGVGSFGDSKTFIENVFSERDIKQLVS
jgi:hypothetical protein